MVVGAGWCDFVFGCVVSDGAWGDVDAGCLEYAAELLWGSCDPLDAGCECVDDLCLGCLGVAVGAGVGLVWCGVFFCPLWCVAVGAGAYEFVCWVWLCPVFELVGCLGE